MKIIGLLMVLAGAALAYMGLTGKNPLEMLKNE